MRGNMKFSISKLLRSRPLLVASPALIAGATLLALTAGTNANNDYAGAPRISASREQEKRKPIPGPALAEGERPEPATLTLNSDGFAPAELTLGAGKVLLILNKRLGQNPAEIELREAGSDNLIHRVRMAENRLRWAEILELRAGTYSLSVVDHPEWACKVTVNPK